jgi:HSP20 family molecular chaperone IbpA
MLRPSIFNDNFTDSLFDEFFNDSFWPARHFGRAQVTQMNTDIKETEDNYQIEMELPGFTKEDVKADLKDGTLTIEASHSENKDEKDQEGKYLRKERYSGSMSRSFYVGEQITQEDIKAKFADGILTILVPKKEKQQEVEQKKYIAIEG